MSVNRESRDSQDEEDRKFVQRFSDKDILPNNSKKINLIK